MSSRRKISQNEKYDAAKDETLTKVGKLKQMITWKFRDLLNNVKKR